MDPMSQKTNKALPPALAAVFVLAGIVVLLLSINPFAQTVTPIPGPTIPLELPGVTWEPETLVIALSPGETKTVTVTATSDGKVPATTVQLSPELQPHVTVAPMQLPRFNGPSQLSLELTFEIPAGTQYQEISGTLVLKGPKIAVNVPMPVAINVWPSDSVDGIQLNYPPNVQVVRGASSIVFLPQTEEQGTEIASLSVSFDRNPDHLSLEEFYDGDPEADLFGSSEPPASLEISGRPAFKFDPWIGLGATVVYVVPLSSDFLVITDTGTDPETLEAFLASILIPEGM